MIAIPIRRPPPKISIVAGSGTEFDFFSESPE
jgi:hypothetical protein